MTSSARFIDFERVGKYIAGNRVAIVGSGPSVLSNVPGFVDSHDLVIRVNNHKTSGQAGFRTDIHYSFYGTSIRKTVEELKAEGVWMCLCKLPNSQPLESEWHRQNGKLAGIDYRYIYEKRAAWWFCDTFIPDDAHFLAKFELLGKHQPTTGFAAILDVLACKPRSVFLTGYDFFTSGLHNVDERWREKNHGDPICHRPDLEADWLRKNAGAHPLSFDQTIANILFTKASA